MKDDLRQRLLQVAQSLERLGLATVGPAKGSCSARDFETGTIYLTPSGQAYSELQPDMLATVDAQGRANAGSKPSVDLPFHLAIYKIRPDVGAVMHLHTPYASAFAVIRQEIPVYLQSLANVVGGPVPVAEFALPGTAELAANIVSVLGQGKAALMANHGVVTCGRTPEECLTVIATVETAAQVTLLSGLIGKPVRLTPEQIDGARGFYANRFFTSGNNREN
jgi:L-fuculose-phosphate aldolase